MHEQRACLRHGGTFETSLLCASGEVSLVRRPFDNGGIPPELEIGTSAAINFTPGVAADLSGRSVRGGARNRGDRESYHLNARQVANLRAATDHATLIGRPFTRMVTIHWQAAGVPLAGMAKATGAFTDYLTKSLARHGSMTAYIWTHEGGEEKGGHCHLLFYVPAELTTMVTKMQRGWLRRIAGNPYRGGVILSRPIGGRLGLESSNPDLHAANLEVAFAYLCKGAPQTALDRFGIDRLHESGGLVIGKRCSASQNIGRKAREAHETAQYTRAREER